MRTRDDRRRASARALKHGRKIAKGWGLKGNDLECVAHKLRDTPKLCSCSMCANKRRRDSADGKGREKLTLAERKQRLAEREELT